MIVLYPLPLKNWRKQASAEFDKTAFVWYSRFVG